MQANMLSEISWRGRQAYSSPANTLPPPPSRAGTARPSHVIGRAARKRRIRDGLFFVCLAFILMAVTYAAASQWWWGPLHQDAMNAEAWRACEDQLRLPGSVGFSNAPSESTVLLLFDTNESVHVAHADGNVLSRWFAALSEVFLSTQTTAPSTDRPSPSEGSPPQDSSSALFFDDSAATAWVVDRARGEAVPLQMDVVYTYVNQSTPAFASRLRERGSNAAHTKFFRDWGELQYSLRSLWHAAMDPAMAPARVRRHERRRRDEAALAALGLSVVADDVDGAGDTPSCPSAQFSLVRRVILVVADDDQIPHWLSADSLCRVHIVRHEALFTEAEQADHALPTFNSLAIESTLHRIPGLSRFWWYFNNDMLIGRPVTVFDLFRPLTPPRQRTHFQSYTMVDDASHGATGAAGPLPWEDATRAWPRGCGAAWLEPLIHSDHSASFSLALLPSLERAVWSSHLQSLADPFLTDASVSTVERTKRCLLHAMSTPVKGRSPWRTTVFTAPVAVRPALACRNALNHHAHYVAKTALEGVPPTMFYAHLPQLIDTRLFSRMLEDPVDGLTDEARRIRLSFRRELNNFSPVHVYGYYALAMRRAVERDLWRRLRHTLAASVPSAPADPTSTAAAPARLSFCDVCPLCTHTHAVNLQHPELLLELAAWWPVNTSSSSPSSMASSAAEACRCRADVLGDPGAAARLRRHYLALTEHRNPTLAPDADPERLQGLLSDAFHHVGGNILRFIMVEDLLQLAMKVRLLEDAASQSTTAPLFTTVNDDMPHEYIESARSTSQSWGLYLELFDRLLRLSAYRGEMPSPFERMP